MKVYCCDIEIISFYWIFQLNNEHVALCVGISSKTTDQDQIARYRSLLLGELDGIEEEDKDDVDMEITWEPTLDELGEEEVSETSMLCLLSSQSGLLISYVFPMVLKTAIQSRQIPVFFKDRAKALIKK